MTRGQLSIISAEDRVEDEKPTLKSRLNTIVEERRARTIDSVSKTIIYHVELGAVGIMFDEIPNIINADVPFMLRWLEEQGFEIEKPRFGGRAKVLFNTD